MPLYCLSVFLLSCMGLRLSFGEFEYLRWSFFLRSGVMSNGESRRKEQKVFLSCLKEIR
jgi:hypothetical protein